jgi:hypothetical protein
MALPIWSRSRHPATDNPAASARTEAGTASTHHDARQLSGPSWATGRGVIQQSNGEFIVTQSSTPPPAKRRAPRRAAPASKSSIWPPGVVDKTAEVAGETLTVIGAPSKTWRLPPNVEWVDPTSDKYGETLTVIGAPRPAQPKPKPETCDGR